MNARILPALFLLLALFPFEYASAHGRSVSYSRWEIEGDTARVRVRVSQLELTRLGIRPETPSQHTAGYLVDRLVLESDAGACTPNGKPIPSATAEGWVAFSWSVTCPSTDELRLHSRLLLDVAPSHLHFARLQRANGGSIERVLTEAEPVWALGAVADGSANQASGAGTSIPGYVLLGIEHILSGWDHLAFVVALLLLAASFGEVATLVTSFTVAHSVTLGLAALGVLHPDAAAVEAMIGFSIALVAAENSWLLGGLDRRIPWGVAALALAFAGLAIAGIVATSPLAFCGLALFSLCHFGLLHRAQRPARLRAAVAFAFGLVHGFGFAGVLGEMELERARLLPALFGFNAGVELGQLAVVAIVWPGLALLARTHSGRWHRTFAQYGSAAICGLGIFWFVTRLL